MAVSTRHIEPLLPSGVPVPLGTSAAVSTTSLNLAQYVPLATSAGVSTASLSLTAQTQIPLATSAAVATTSLNLSQYVPLATSAAVSTTSLALTAQTQIPLGASAAVSTASLALTAQTTVALGTSAATSTTYLELNGQGPYGTNVLDTFNRPDENPLGNGNWTTFAGSGLKIVSQQVLSAGTTGTFSDSAWTGTTIARPAELFFLFVANGNANQIQLLAYDTIVGGSNGYLITLTGNVGNDSLKLWRRDIGVDTQFGSTYSGHDFVAGDRLALVVNTTSVEAWGNFGGTGWTKLISQASDTTYAGPFKPIIPISNTGFIIDNFGGGTFAPLTLSSAGVSTATLSLTAQTQIPLATSAGISTTSLSLSAQTQIPLATSAAVATTSLALSAQTQIPLGTSAAVATTSLNLAQYVPLGTSAAVATTSLLLTILTPVPLATSAATSTASLSLTAQTQVPLGTSAAVSTASLAMPGDYRGGGFVAPISGHTTETVTTDVAPLAGNLLVAAVTVNGGTATTITPPDVGWTQGGNFDVAANFKFAWFWKIATGSEGTSYVWNWGATNRSTVAQAIYWGPATIDAVAESVGADTSTASVTSNTVSTFRNNERITYLVGGRGTSSQVTVDPDVALVERQEASPNPGASPWFNSEISDEHQGTQGTTTARTFTVNNANHSHVFVVPLVVGYGPTTLALSTSAGQSTATLALTAQTQIPLGTSAAVATTSLNLAQYVPLATSAGVSTTSLALTAQTVIALGTSAATSTTYLELNGLGPYGTIVRDYFNRPDENPLGNGNWTTFSTGPLQIVSNQAVSTTANGTFSGSAWTATTYARPAEVYYTVQASTTTNVIQILAFDTIVGGSNGYVLFLFGLSGNDQVKLGRRDIGVDTQFGSTYTGHDFVAGDRLALVINTTSIEAWGNFGGVGWTKLITQATDTTYAGPFKPIITMSNTAYAVDNFGAGTFVPLTLSSAGVSTTSLSLVAQTQIPLATSAGVSTTSLVLSAQTTIPLGTSAAAATTSLALTAATTIALGTSAATSTTSLALTAQTQVSLGTSAATSTTALTLTAATQIPLTTSVGISTTSLALTAATQIPLGSSNAVATTSIFVNASGAALVPLSTSDGVSTTSLSLSAQTSVPLNTSAATSTTSLALTAQTQIPLASSAATSTTSLNLAQYVVLATSAATSTTALNLTAQTRIVLTTSAATSTTSLALTAPTQIPLAASSAVSTTILALTAQTQIPLATSAATSTTSLALVVQAGVPLSSSNTVATTSLAITAQTRIPLSTSAATTTTSLSILSTPHITLGASSGVSSTGSLGIRVPAGLTLTSSATSSASLKLRAKTRIPLGSSNATSSTSLHFAALIHPSASHATSTAHMVFIVPAGLPLNPSHATSLSSLLLSSKKPIPLGPSVAVSHATLGLIVIIPAGDISLWIEETVKTHYYLRNTDTLAIWSETVKMQENPAQERLKIEPDEQNEVVTPKVEYRLHIDAETFDVGSVTIKEPEKTLFVKDTTASKIIPTG